MARPKNISSCHLCPLCEHNYLLTTNSATLVAATSVSCVKVLSGAMELPVNIYTPLEVRSVIRFFVVREEKECLKNFLKKIMVTF